jgi:protein phosphatase
MPLPFFRRFQANTAITWQSAAQSDVGRVRKNNQDALLNAPERALWAVADGMGGYSSGEWASKTIIAALDACPLSGSMKQREQQLRQTLQEVNTSIKKTAEESQQRSGSTLVLLHIYQRQALYLWVGDSRIYRFRQGVLTQVTHDHSLTERLIAQGKISRQEAEGHPGAHVITRAVGIEEQVLVDSCYETVLPGDAWLLCSDGLTREVTENQLIEIFRTAASLEIAANRMLEQALKNGGRDNITLCLVQGQHKGT